MAGATIAPTLDDAIEKLLVNVSADELGKHPLESWLQTFDGTNDEQRREKAKDAIKDTVRKARGQKTQDPETNFLLKLASAEDGNEQENRLRLATRIVYAMKEMKENVDTKQWWSAIWKPFLHSTAKCDPVILTAFHKRDKKSTPLGDFPLHEAAFLGDSDTVKRFINGGNTAMIDNQGRTPLHYAAMAIVPDVEMAKYLVEKLSICMKNKHSDKENGWNTALHVAAGNANVSQEFIDALNFENADPMLLNLDCETAFHIAARSKNPNAILYMLKTFAPTQNRWDVDCVDELQYPEDAAKNAKANLLSKIPCLSSTKSGESDAAHQRDEDEYEKEDLNWKEKCIRKFPCFTRRKERRGYNRLINICARNGNVKAVELLIKNGADISQGVLHEIVLESVKNPEKIVKLKAVYQVIVDNAVTWKCLENHNVNPLKASMRYKQILKETMVWLLRHPLSEYEDKDVLQYAISLGANEMFQQIINTKGVLRQEKRNRKVRYDITNFTRATMIFEETAQRSSEDAGREDGGDEGTGNPGENGAAQEPGTSQRTPLLNTCEKHKCDKPNKPPAMPYLTHLLSSFDQWKHTNILSTQPLKQLTDIFFIFIQRLYLFIGSVQLIFMICFTMHYSPTICYLSEMFNLTSKYCSSSSDIAKSKDIPQSLDYITSFYKSLINVSTNKSDTSPSFDMDSNSEHQRYLPSGFWLIWPIFLLAGNIAWSCFNFVFTKQKYSLNSIFKFVGTGILVRLFCLFVFVWFHRHRHSETYGPYVEITAMVQLFGWMTCVEYFAAANRHINISMLLVKQILKKDIPGFVLFFGFTVIGFSFAMHALRMSACELNERMTLRDSFYGVLSSAFGIGDFYDMMIEDSKCEAGRTQNLFEIVYFAYIAVTLIILLNLLIAMMNNRYEVDKENAENIWRYENLSMVRAMESHENFFKVFGVCLKRDGVRKYVSKYSECMMWVAAILCCFWYNYDGLPKRKMKGKDQSKEFSYYYLTIQEHGDKE